MLFFSRKSLIYNENDEKLAAKWRQTVGKRSANGRQTGGKNEQIACVAYQPKFKLAKAGVMLLDLQSDSIEQRELALDADDVAAR